VCAATPTSRVGLRWPTGRTSLDFVGFFALIPADLSA
jgi:hypothetical protein